MMYVYMCANWLYTLIDGLYGRARLNAIDQLNDRRTQSSLRYMKIWYV
jgi:hypothetical protein